MQRRRPRLLLRGLAACVPVLGLALGLGPAAGASQVPARSASAHAALAARAALQHLTLAPSVAGAPAPGRPRRIPSLTTVTSTAWGGYAVDNSAGNIYNGVSGSWVQPSVRCTSAQTLVGFWVGIDGYSDSTLEQAGTLAECYEGVASYYTFWTMYPSTTVHMVGTTLRPGDNITASVTRNGTNFTLAVADTSDPSDSFSAGQTCDDCDAYSMEWIHGIPPWLRLHCCSSYPLANYGSWTVSNAIARSNSITGVISTFPDDQITLVNASGSALSLTGPLNVAGNSFTTTWMRS